VRVVTTATFVFESSTRESSVETSAESKDEMNELEVQNEKIMIKIKKA